jgi:geranylgeranyl pyrophosphate synthase
MTGGRGAGPEGATLAAGLPDAVKRIALAIEVFHKASLIHDDIEDDDPFRYGQPALHRRFGTSLAINVGDYLIGLGYRLVAAQRQHLPGAAIAEILAHLAEAHTKLCEGQGAELAWRRAGDKRLAPLEALKIYALKTAPAFEAALATGLRLAGPVETLLQPAAQFARHLGVGFQVLNDLDDWQAEPSNKRATGTDVLGGRPTVLWAMAMESLDPAQRRHLEELVARPPAEAASTLESVRALYHRAGVYQQARELVAKHRQRAHALAESVQPAPLTHLMHYLTDIILQG